MPTLQTFTLDDSVVAKRIYRDYPHQTTSVGLVVEEAIKQELSLFLRGFLDFINYEEQVFLRLDVFVEDDALHIIEINVELQDGWGVGLNLLRASGNKPRFTNDMQLPTEVIVYNEDYLA